MSYRVRRKFTSSTFQVGDHLCKIFLQPVHEYRPGFWLWNIQVLPSESHNGNLTIGTEA